MTQAGAPGHRTRITIDKEVVPMRLTAGTRLICASFALATLATPRFVQAGFDTYVALGDSLAFGEEDFTVAKSDGTDRGYVLPFSNHLKSLNGGVAPRVIDLGVDGETSSTFFNYSGPPGIGWESGKPDYTRNSNYDGLTTTQHGLLGQVIAESVASGHSIDVVTVQLGSNDLLALTLDPNFMGLSALERQQQVGQLLINTVGPNLGALVGELKMTLPGVKVALLGYYDPYEPFAASPDPIQAAQALEFGAAIHALNLTIANVAQLTGAQYIDLETPFRGHIPEYTYMLVPNPNLPGPNVHPNAIGYGVIAEQLRAVPEPGSLTLLAGGLLGLAGFASRRRAASR